MAEKLKLKLKYPDNDNYLYTESDVEIYDMGGTLVKTLPAKILELPVSLKQNLIRLSLEAEQKDGVVYNRLRFDLACVDSSEEQFYIYEVNAGNPLGGFTTYDTLLLHEYEEEAKELKDLLLSIFQGKIAILAKHPSNTFFNSELKRFIEEFENSGQDYIVENFTDIHKYLNDDNYVIWYMGDLDFNGENPYFYVENIYGGKSGKSGVGNKSNLPKYENHLIMPSEIISIDEKFIVPSEKVIKIFEGEQNYGGNGVFKEGEQPKYNGEVLIQNLIVPEYEVDIILLKSEGDYKFIAFQRVPFEGQFLANLSQGKAVYIPIIIQWV